MGKRSRQKRESERLQPSGRAESPPYIVIGIATALMLVVLVVYAQVRTHAFINFDDPAYVFKNPHVATGLTGSNVVWAFTHTYASNWHPLTWISHMLDVQLFGLDAGKHALTSVVIHAINSVLLFFVLRRATKRIWPSAMVAALFALHPLHVESVAWIAERKDVLCAFFFLLALWFYLGGRRWLTFAAFACALMAKPMAITLPFVLLLLDWWPLERWSPRDLAPLKQLVIDKWPLFLLIPISAAITAAGQEEAMTHLALPLRLANAAISYVAYLGKAIWPLHLAIFYPYRTTMSAGLAVAAFVLLVAITIAVLRFATRFPYLAVGWLWFVGMLVPVIGIVQVGQQSMADRYMYLPLIGLAIAVVWLAADLVRNRAALAVLAAVVLAGCAAQTYRQTEYWTNSMTLFAHAVDVAPNGIVSRVNLGAAYLERLDYASAATQFRAALALNDRDALAHNGLGMALAGTGDKDAARREYETAMVLDPKNAEPYRNLGNLELAAGAPQKALPLLEKANALAPDEATTAALAAARGNADDAIEHYRRAVAAEPDKAESRNDLAALLARGGHDAEALEQYQEALRIAPENYEVRMNIGALLSRMDRNNDAASQFEAASRLRPQSSEPHVYLAILYANLGRLPDAIREVKTAGTLDPVAANQQFTNAVHIAFRPTNLEEYLGFLEQRAVTRRATPP